MAAHWLDGDRCRQCGRKCPADGFDAGCTMPVTPMPAAGGGPGGSSSGVDAAILEFRRRMGMHAPCQVTEIELCGTTPALDFQCLIYVECPVCVGIYGLQAVKEAMEIYTESTMEEDVGAKIIQNMRWLRAQVCICAFPCLPVALWW